MAGPWARKLCQLNLDDTKCLVQVGDRRKALTSLDILDEDVLDVGSDGNVFGVESDGDVVESNGDVLDGLDDTKRLVQVGDRQIR